MSNETKTLLGIGIITLVIVIAAAYFVGGKPSATENQITTPIKNTQALLRKDSHQTGPTNAKVTFVEFADFQCPGCGVASPVVKQLREAYKGKVNYVFRQFPLQMHKNSRPAAEAAEAAGAQGKFFEMGDTLFANQDEWKDSDNPVEIYAKYAKALGLDVDRFKKEVTEQKYKDKIEADIKDGYAVDIQYTPTFFINGVQQQGGIDYNNYKAQFDKLLSK